MLADNTKILYSTHYKERLNVLKAIVIQQIQSALNKIYILPKILFESIG